MTHKDHMSGRIDPRALAFVQGQAAGEWDDETICKDAIRLTALLEAAENDALERAANVARHLNGWGTKPAPELAEHIASVIRSLKSKATP